MHHNAIELFLLVNNNTDSIHRDQREREKAILRLFAKRAVHILSSIGSSGTTVIKTRSSITNICLSAGLLLARVTYIFTSRSFDWVFNEMLGRGFIVLFTIKKIYELFFFQR